MQHVLTVTQASERLGVSRFTLHRMIDAGNFPNAYRLNPRNPKSEYRIPVSDVEQIEKERIDLAAVS